MLIIFVALFLAVVTLRGQQIDINTQTKGILAANRVDPAVRSQMGSFASDAEANSNCGGSCPANTSYKRTTDGVVRFAVTAGAFQGMLYGELATGGHVPVVSAPGTLGLDATAGKELFRNPTNGFLGVGTATPTARLHVTGPLVRPFDTASMPASTTDPCNAGELRYDSNFLYLCIATNTWRRSPLSTW